MEMDFIWLLTHRAPSAWILWVVVQGRRRDIGLGGVSLVGLAEALKEANHMLYMLKNKNLSDAEARIT
ncbi:hypothetical protein [Mesorhizobium sp. M0051]